MTAENAKNLFETNILGHLATVNEDGSPWSTPLHLVTDGDAVYWFSSSSTVHSANIARSNKVMLSLFAPDTSQGPTGVYVQGEAEQVSDEDRPRIVDLFMKRTGSFPPGFDGVPAFKVEFGYLNEDKSTRRCWYFYN